MAIRSVATTDTLGTFRTTFNTLSTDLGDLQDLNTSDKSSVVASINEAITQTSSFFLRDSGSSIQEVSSGDTVNIIGDSNITTTISATDTIGVALSSTVTGLTSISATTVTDGTASLNSGSLSSIVNIGGTGNITGFSQISGTTINGTTINGTTDVQVNSVSVATKPFAIAQAIALG